MPGAALSLGGSSVPSITARLTNFSYFSNFLKVPMKQEYASPKPARTIFMDIARNIPGNVSPLARAILQAKFSKLASKTLLAS